MKHGILFSAVFAVASCVALCGCRGGAKARPASARGILLVTLSEGSATPEDAAAMGLAPLDFRPVSAELLPSAASAITGLLPPEHGLRTDGVGSLAPEVRTLASDFAARGGVCAAFLSDRALSPIHALTNGFSEYSVVPAAADSAVRHRAGSAVVCEAAAKWLAGRSDASRPVFLWLHLSPFGGSAPTWAGSASPKRRAIAAEGDLAGLSEIVAMFDETSAVVVVPLFEAVATDGGDGFRRSFAPPGSEGAPAASLGFVRAVRDSDGGVSVADVPWLLGFAEERRPSYWESIVPWYAFRLPPLCLAGENAPDARGGICGAPRPEALAHQSEMAALKAAGHVGEGLIPPLPPDVAFAVEMAPEAAAVIDDWRAAVAASTAGEAAAALVARPPGIPAFLELQGSALAAKSDFAAARDAFAGASRIGYNMIFANRMLSRCHAALGEMAASIDRAEAAFLAGPTDPVTRRELARLLLETGAAMGKAGELRTARDCIDRVLLLEPENQAARFESAWLLLESTRTNEARFALRALLRDAPGFARAAALLRSIDGPGAAEPDKN